MTEAIKNVDLEVYDALKKELNRQRDVLEMIASENFVSLAVMQAQGSVFTNKYAEGKPFKRYYGGCEHYDYVEDLAVQRIKKLFNAEHANVQPHSGSSANLAAYRAVLEPGDTVLGPVLAHGGHLSHGSPVNFSGQDYNFVQYGLDPKTHRFEPEELLKVAKEHKPKLILCGYSAYPRVVDFEAFKKVADEVGALLMADIAHIAGLIAAGVHPQPFPHCDIVTTTTHKTLRGARGGVVMCKEKFAKKVDSVIFPGTQGGPLMHCIAGKAVAFKEAMTPEFKEYQIQIVRNAKALAEGLLKYGFDLVTGGTDNHLMLLDLTNKNITGKEAENLLESAGITANKNMVPYDKQSPFVTSGIRLGTPALTTRGMKEPEMQQIADFINLAVENRDNESVKQKIRQDVAELCKRFPLYPTL